MYTRHTMYHAQPTLGIEFRPVPVTPMDVETVFSLVKLLVVTLLIFIGNVYL